MLELNRSEVNESTQRVHEYLNFMAINENKVFIGLYLRTEVKETGALKESMDGVCGQYIKL